MGTNLQSVLCVSRLARPTMAAGAAIVAGAIAVVTAIEAWFSLQGAAGLTGTHPQPPPEAVGTVVRALREYHAGTDLEAYLVPGVEPERVVLRLRIGRQRRSAYFVRHRPQGRKDSLYTGGTKSVGRVARANEF